MQVAINGEAKDIAAGITVLALLEQLGLNPKLVVAQRNEEIVERQEYGSVILEEGDNLEFVRFVGGG